MFTIYLTFPRIGRQTTISHPKLDEILVIVKHLRISRDGATLRVWSSKKQQFII